MQFDCCSPTQVDRFQPFSNALWNDFVNSVAQGYRMIIFHPFHLIPLLNEADISMIHLFNCTALTMSFLTTSRLSRKNTDVNLSGPGALSLLHSLRALNISFSSKGPSTQVLASKLRILLGNNCHTVLLVQRVCKMRGRQQIFSLYPWPNHHYCPW